MSHGERHLVPIVANILKALMTMMRYSYMYAIEYVCL